MLSNSLIRNILQNKKYYTDGFYKNEFREFEGNIQLDDGQVISYEQVEERIRDEENYFDPLFHLLEIEKDENEGYYCNIVFFNKCNGEGYWAGFDVNGFNKKGYNKKGFNKKGYNMMGFNSGGFNKKGYNEDGYNEDGYNEDGYNEDGYNEDGYNEDGYHEDEYNIDSYIENWCGFDVNDLDGYDTVRLW